MIQYTNTAKNKLLLYSLYKYGKYEITAARNAKRNSSDANMTIELSHLHSVRS